jgi:hypothetical protein
LHLAVRFRFGNRYYRIESPASIHSVVDAMAAIALDSSAEIDRRDDEDTIRSDEIKEPSERKQPLIRRVLNPGRHRTVLFTESRAVARPMWGEFSGLVQVVRSQGNTFLDARRRGTGRK